MKKLIKRVINFGLKILFSIGVGKVLHRINQDKITIISMHGIMYAHEHVLWRPLRDQLDPKSLERTVDTLSKYYTFISLEQAHSILSGREQPVKNGLVFTLDDGYWNNLEYAGPIFEKYKVTPTIFVATKNIDECSPFWFDRLDYALQQLKGNQYPIKLLNHDFSFDLTSREMLKKSYASFREIIKQNFLKDEDMRDLLDSLSSEIERVSGKSLSNIIESDDWTRIANWKELHHASLLNKFNVGSHTVDHIRIALVSENIMEFQLQTSKHKIENELGISCQYFCYPNGSYSKKSAEKVSQSGYSLAVTTEIGMNAIGDDLMTLKRFNIPSKKRELDILYALSLFKV
tara:strand:+ start:4536 stop:5573 length:1038 start_codon:yes stop_codon:yes gene_type:complete